MLHLYCTNGGKKRMEFEEDALRFTNGVNKNRVLEIDNPECTNDISLVGRALTAPVRIQILHMLNKKPMLLSQIAAELDLPLSSAAFHLRVLEDAQLITIDFSTKRKGTLKWYSYALRKASISEIISTPIFLPTAESPPSGSTLWKTSREERLFPNGGTRRSSGQDTAGIFCRPFPTITQ